MKLHLFILLFIISSCTSGIKMTSVNYGDLFHDSNSKVWLIDQITFKNAIISPYNTHDKDVIIFHANGTCDYLPLKEIGKEKPKKGSFTIDSNNKTIDINFLNKEDWRFSMKILTEDSIYLDPLKGSELKYKLKLKPFPEL